MQRRIKKDAQAIKTGLALESEESSVDWIPMLSTNKKTSNIQVRGLNVYISRIANCSFSYTSRPKLRHDWTLEKDFSKTKNVTPYPLRSAR